MGPKPPRIFFHFSANPYKIKGINLPKSAFAEYNLLFNNQLATSIRPTRTCRGLFIHEKVLGGEFFVEYVGECITKAPRIDISESATVHFTAGIANTSSRYMRIYISMLKLSETIRVLSITSALRISRSYL